MADTDGSDHFVALSECHFLNPEAVAEISGYYPNTARWWKSVQGVLRAWSGIDMSVKRLPPIASTLIKYMDEAGVDVAFCLREGMMDISGGVMSLSSNQFMLEQIAVQGPHVPRGDGRADPAPRCRARQLGARAPRHQLRRQALQGVPARGPRPLDDPRMWPFYEKACELDVTLTVHTGMAYTYPQPSAYTHPNTLDKVLIDFPDLRIIAYHMGWPHTEELIGLAGKHENLYLSLSGIVGWYERSPHRGYPRSARRCNGSNRTRS